MKKLILCTLLGLMSFASFGESFLGKTPISTVFKSYATGNVTSTAWVEVVHSMPSSISFVQIYDTSGQVIKIARGASGSEVAIPLTIPRGGNDGDGFLFQISSGDRISVKSGTATATTGELIMNFFQ